MKKKHIDETFKQIMGLLDELAEQEQHESSKERSDAVLRKLGMIKATVKMPPRPDKGKMAVASMSQPYDTIQKMMLQQEGAKQKALSYLEDLDEMKINEMREAVEELDTNERAMLLYEVLGGLSLVGHMKGMYHAMKSLVRLMPIFSELLQRTEHVSETVEILHNLLQHRDELEKLSRSVPEMNRILSDIQKYMPFTTTKEPVAR